MTYLQNIAFLQRNYYHFFLLSNLILFNHSQLGLANSDTIINIGTRVFVSKLVENYSSGEQREFTDGNQLSLNLSLQKKEFYTSYSIHVGKYDYTAVESFEGQEITGNFQIRRVETDFLVGYYFLENLSVFLDYKTINNRAFINPDFLTTLTFQGIGVGLSSHYLITRKWSLFGSFGVIPDGDKLVNYPTIDRSNSVSLEFGSAYSLKNNSNINFGLRIQKQQYWINDTNKTNFTQEITGVFIGYNYSIR